MSCRVSSVAPEIDLPVKRRMVAPRMLTLAANMCMVTGMRSFSLRPKRSCADDLGITNSALGICLQGAHLDLIEGAKYDTSLAKKIYDVNVKIEAFKIWVHSHPEFLHAVNEGIILKYIIKKEKGQNSFKPFRSVSNQKEEKQLKNFIEGEKLGTETIPKCGGCHCGKCPKVDHTHKNRN